MKMYHRLLLSILIIALLLSSCQQKISEDIDPSEEILTNDVPKIVKRLYPTDDSEHSEIYKLFIDCLDTPTAESYLSVRDAVISSQFYDPYSEVLLDIEDLMEISNWNESLDKIYESMPNLLLNPRAHLFRAIIYENKGENDLAQLEHEIASLCIAGILATGDGTRDHPYLTIGTSDEFDVLSHLGKDFTSSKHIEEKNRHLDLFICSDGTEVWFDITDQYKKLMEIFGAE
jgi:hypothetical protein